MADSATATIPSGYWVDGTCCREVELRAPSGADHVDLADDAVSLLPAHWTTEVLARCVTRLGDGAPVTRETVRSLTVGDREALLLHLRRLINGDAAPCAVACPDCRERLDLALTVSGLLVPPYPTPHQVHEVGLRERDMEYRVRFRLPTGGDQERAALVAREDLPLAADLLLHQCVEAVVRADGSPIERVPVALQGELAAVMSERDAQAELTLNVACASCGHRFSAVFDAARYLAIELRYALRALERDRHLLALHYHWSPSEILAMPSRQRRRCVAVLEHELSRSPGR